MLSRFMICKPLTNRSLTDSYSVDIVKKQDLKHFVKGSRTPFNDTTHHARKSTFNDSKAFYPPTETP